jgi:lipoate---protein ligase
MHYLDLTLPTLAENLALDEALLLRAEEGGPEVLRVWQWPTPAVVLGAGGILADDVDEARCRADDVPILRRASGGGTVLLGPGCLIYSVVLAFARDPALGELFPSYGYVLERVIEAAGMLGAALDIEGASDLALGGRKISGNAQQRKRTHLLHHGTLLHAFDAAAVAAYLKAPARQPVYRRLRSHGDFLTNLPAGADPLKQALRVAWQAEPKLTIWPQDLVLRLLVEKYLRPEWIFRR